jgi:hypothetical protein
VLQCLVQASVCWMFSSSFLCLDPQVELRSAPFRRCELSEARIELNWIECG